jgi:serine/threonine protein kinase/tetratricopeptide (TPR) repeat protein
MSGFAERKNVTRKVEIRDERLMELVEMALSLPHSQREAWVRESCADDPELAREASTRIHWELEMEGFLSEPILGFTQPAEFEPGQTLGERLRIVRKIADGGMAVVYQAEDENIGTVAIKVPKPAFRRRLLAEARFALQVTHPNICRVHGVESCRTDAGDLNFLTMEYLEGETLQERILRSGPLPIPELREIAEQLCAGLSEAHRRGVVHGDLKGSNVILTSRNGSMRAVITDFGLARAPGPGVSAITTSIRGTPDFLAPEIWTGGAVSVASDLYALGVLLYELATGARPFPEDPSRQRRAALIPPRRRRRDLPRQWNSIIENCLKINPQDRPENAQAVARAFAPRWSASPGLTALFIIMIVLAGAAGLTLPRDAPPGSPIRIAVLPMDSDGDSAIWGGGALRRISTVLPEYRGTNGPVVIIPTLDNLGEDPAATLKQAGATHLVSAKFRKSGDGVQADLSVRETKTGQELMAFSGNYSRASIGSLPQALVAAVTAALQLRGSAPPGRMKSAAWPDYLKGEGELQKPQPDLDEALSAFQASSQVDPEASLPWAGMTTALELKYQLKSDPALLALARNALREAMSRDPDAVEVHLAAGSVNRLSGFPQRAAAEYSRALQIEPGNVEAMRRLAQSYSDMDLPVQAVQTWQRALSQLPNYYKTYLDLGQFYYYRARYNDAAEQFLRVTQLAPQVAMGHHDLGAVYNDLGKYAEAEESFRRALALREHSDTLIGLGALMDYKRRTVEAVQFYERAREVGPVTYILLVDLGDAYRRIQRNADARRTYEEGLALADRDLLERPKDGYVRAFVAYLSARLGDRVRAERELAQALYFSPEETKVKRTAVLTYGALGRVQDAQAILAAEPSLQDEMTRQPDVSEFSPEQQSKK